jgi:hypothetical protein
MPIVLAIEPDRRQAAHLTAIVRPMDAELVIADTTEGALDAIGNRVPDLVLVPALLSPQDDAALAAALRVIAAAAHVRTLTIPVLASGVKRAQSGGMLSKWRKNKAASPEPDGCDPAVFGEQISAYLQEAAAERAQLEEAAAERAQLEADALLNQKRIEVEPPEHSIDVDFPDVTAAVTVFLHADAAPIMSVEQPWDAVEPVHLLTANLPEEATIEPNDNPLIDLSSELEGLSEDAASEAVEGEAAAVYTIAAEGDMSVFDVFDLMPGILDPPSITEEVEAALDQIAAAAKIRPQPMAALKRKRADVVRAESARVEPIAAQPASVDAAQPPRPDITPWVPMYLTPGRIWPALEGVPAETPPARTEQPDWIELVASLRQDLERRRTDPASAADPIAARPSDGADAKVHRLVKKPRVHVKKAKPVQDEWGFFDPERCGFSTLLAKLEEITEEDVRT